MTKDETLQARFGLDGQVFVVTGGASGIGFRTARAAGTAGARVVINDLQQDRCDAAVAELADAGIDAMGVAFDVTEPDAVKAGIARAVGRFGRIDALFSNAGNQNRKPFDEYAPEEWQSIQSTHVNGAFNMCQAVLPTMMAQGSGRIVLMSSVTALGMRGTVSAYGTAKGALAALTRALAVEYGPKGIATNAIAPGYVCTGFTVAMQDNEAFESYIATEVPMGRWADPDDIADVVVFLVGPGSRFINGQVLGIDGGLLATL